MTPETFDFLAGCLVCFGSGVLCGVLAAVMIRDRATSAPPAGCEHRWRYQWWFNPDARCRSRPEYHRECVACGHTEPITL